MCINYFYKKKYGISKPENTKEITHDELYFLLYDKFKCNVLELSDRKYEIAPKSEYRRFLKYDDTDRYVYTSDWFDCDDYSVHLHGNITIPYWSRLAFGEIWVHTGKGGHALNLFVDSEYKIWLVEPQNDKIFEMPDDWDAYRIEI